VTGVGAAVGAGFEQVAAGGGPGAVTDGELIDDNLVDFELVDDSGDTAKVQDA